MNLTMLRARKTQLPTVIRSAVEKRVLLTSFPAFGRNKVNVSNKVMTILQSRVISGISIEPLLLSCDEAGSNKVSEKIQNGEKYDAIIQMGLAESRKIISMERWAHNKSDFSIADNSGRISNEEILKDAPPKYQTTVSKHILDEEFEEEEDVQWSENAGSFVCNETFFRTLNSIESNNLRIPAIFIHLPPEEEIDIERQIEVISRIIQILAIKPTLRVVGALLFDSKNRILSCRRPPEDVWGGWWEFPGGKIDPGESEETALRREISEELGIHVNPKSKVATINHEYEDRFVSLYIWDCGIVDSNAIIPIEHDVIKWLDQKSLDSVKWLPADEPLIEKWMKSGIPRN